MKAEDLLSLDDLNRELVDVPEWGKSVYVRCLTAGELDAYDMSLMEDASKGQGRMVNARAKLVVRAACNEDGSRIFLDSQAEALGRKNGSAISRLFEVANRLCGRSVEVQKEMEKNSESGGAEGSPSA